MYKKPVFKGFSTYNSESSTYLLTDIELIKQDILNTFNTRIGERVMMPLYGSNIHTYLFNPLDEISKELIIEDAKRVISYEPRVELESISLTDSEHTIRLEIILNFITFYTSDMLYVTFSKQTLGDM